MAQTLASTLQSALTLYGDPSKPVPPGTVIATVPPKDEFYENEELVDLPYPPIIPEGSGCTFDSEKLTLATAVWGRLSFTNEGLRLRQSWAMSRDQMLLTVDVDHVDFSGNPIDIERIRSSLPHALEGIQQDLNFSAVEEALKQSAETGTTVTATVAEGVFPEEGTDALLKLEFEDSHAAGKLREDGTMDFRERSDLYSVVEDDVLGTLHPAYAGEFGYDLYGNPIKPVEVSRITVKTGQGVTSDLNEDGATVYKATKEGVARYRDGLLEVVALLEIQGDVDYSTGNIHAKNGSVHIRGDVKCGFTVECEGDVLIDGVVEEADIIAGGLVIAGGVIMNGNNRIEAKGNVSAHFFRNAIIDAGGDVSADQEMSHCTVTAQGKVTVLGESGIISGGHIISGDDIHARVIGNKACAETCVEIRLPSPSAEKLEAAREEFEKELQRLDRAIGVDFELSSLMSAPEEDRRILAELIRVKGRIEKEIRNIDESKQAMLLESQKLMASKRVTADKKAHCGTEVMICGKGYKLTNTMTAPSFRLDLDDQQITWG